MPKFKKGSKAARDYMASIRAMKKKPAKKSSTRQTGTTDKKKDKTIQAKAPGKRVIKTGKNKSYVYYERRANRSDKGKLLGIGDVSVRNIGAELYDLENQISKLKLQKKAARLVSEKKVLQTKISNLQKQFKALKAYLNTRVQFVSRR